MTEYTYDCVAYVFKAEKFSLCTVRIITVSHFTGTYQKFEYIIQYTGCPNLNFPTLKSSKDETNV